MHDHSKRGEINDLGWFTDMMAWTRAIFFLLVFSFVPIVNANKDSSNIFNDFEIIASAPSRLLLLDAG